ncbi:MAG TPA: 16S rRNA (cytidine(1402)-2'-O)-methyltransferase [Armatimonadota bacterium]|jgi:16S rRNA (cytidine1402-2'-O)-methyltransferase
MPGTLYIVATPIGNLADITLRALSTLREVDLIAAEDTRVTRNLLSHYGIDTPTTAYHQHSLGRKAEQLMEKLLEGQNVALVSDAGTPGISDPGHELIALAIDKEIPVVMIPGASALITAVVESGLPTRRFVFEGFPPRKGSERRSRFSALKCETRTMVFYESPHRVLSSLKDMLVAFGDRPIAIVREATKKFEEVHRGTICTGIECFTARQPRGEFTLVIAGCPEEDIEETVTSEEAVADALRACLDAGMSERDAAREVATACDLPRKEVYRRMLEIKAARSADEE